MSVIAFEDFFPSQSNESFNPVKKQNGEINPNRRFSSDLNKLEGTPESLTLQNNNCPLPVGKSTGNTPRFGAVKKIEPLKPLKPRPAKLGAKDNESAASEYSSVPSGGGSGIEKFLDSHLRGADSPSFTSLSPSNQGRLDTGSVGNSPKRKQCNLKHPFISKRSPLFKKFGLDSRSVSQNNNANISVMSDYEYIKDKIGRKVASPFVENKAADLGSKYQLKQSSDKPPESKNPHAVDFKQMGSHSMVNTNGNKPHEMFSLYSGKKAQGNPRDSLQQRVNSVPYKSDTQHLNSEPAVDWTNSALHAVKAKLLSVKENVSSKKLAEAKPPQHHSPYISGGLNSKSRQLSSNNSLAKASNMKENISESMGISQIVMPPARNKQLIVGDYKRRSLTMNKKSSANKAAYKDNSINESFNSLELSLIAPDTNEKDALNLSRDDALLQYIDKDPHGKEESQKAKKSPFKLPRQLTYDMTTNNDNPDSQRSMKKSTSVSLLEGKEQQTHGGGPMVQQSPFKDFVWHKPPNRRAVSQNTSLNGGKRQVTRSFIADESYIHSQQIADEKMYYSGGNHAQNASMFEISGQYQERSMIYPDDNETLEHLRQRRVESALARPTDTSFDEYMSESNQGRRNYRNIQQPRVLNSEKNNFKHFQFAGSPSMKNTIVDSHDDPKFVFRKPYLHVKPGTTGSTTRPYARGESLNARNRVSNTHHGIGFHSIESVQTNLNDSRTEEACYSSQKVDTHNHLPKTGKGINLPFHIEEHNVKKLRDAIQKLQAKDHESQMRIAKLHMQLEDQNKGWEKKFEAFEQRWKYKLKQQKEYYEKAFTGNGPKRVKGLELS